MTSKSKIKSYDLDYIWHPFTQMKEYKEDEPIVIEDSDGVYLIDSDGNRYIDGVSSLWVNIHGHKVKKIDEAIKKQIDKIAHSTLLGVTNPSAAILAKKLIDIAKKCGCDAVKFQKRTVEKVFSKETLDSPRDSPWGKTTRDQKLGLEFSLEQYLIKVRQL